MQRSEERRNSGRETWEYGLRAALALLTAGVCGTKLVGAAVLTVSDRLEVGGGVGWWARGGTTLSGRLLAVNGVPPLSVRPSLATHDGVWPACSESLPRLAALAPAGLGNCSASRSLETRLDETRRPLTALAAGLCRELARGLSLRAWIDPARTASRPWASPQTEFKKGVPRGVDGKISASYPGDI